MQGQKQMLQLPAEHPKITNFSSPEKFLRAQQLTFQMGLGGYVI